MPSPVTGSAHALYALCAAFRSAPPPRVGQRDFGLSCNLQCERLYADDRPSTIRHECAPLFQHTDFAPTQADSRVAIAKHRPAARGRRLRSGVQRGREARADAELGAPRVRSVDVLREVPHGRLEVRIGTLTAARSLEQRGRQALCTHSTAASSAVLGFGRIRTRRNSETACRCGGTNVPLRPSACSRSPLNPARARSAQAAVTTQKAAVTSCPAQAHAC